MFRAVAFELMNLPAGRPGNSVHIGGYNERRENITQPPYILMFEAG